MMKSLVFSCFWIKKHDILIKHLACLWKWDWFQMSEQIHLNMLVFLVSCNRGKVQLQLENNYIGIDSTETLLSIEELKFKVSWQVSINHSPPFTMFNEDTFNSNVRKIMFPQSVYFCMYYLSYCLLLYINVIILYI